MLKQITVIFQSTCLIIRFASSNLVIFSIKCFFCGSFLFCFFVFHAIRYCLFLAVFWSPVGKGLTSWLSCMWYFLVFVAFPYGVLGKVWYLIVWIPDLFVLSYFEHFMTDIIRSLIASVWLYKFINYHLFIN